MISPHQPNWRIFRRLKRGFSLIELLLTVGLLIVLMSASLPALFGSRRASELISAGNLVADGVSMARQIALSKNTITGLIVTAKPSASARQGMLVMEYDATAEQWKPLGSWMRLPISASVVDMGGPERLAGNAKATAIASLDDLKLGGVSLSDSDYSVLLFYPDGRMENGTSQTRQLSTRYVTDDVTVSSQSLPNFYDVVVNSSTSAFRIERP